MQELMSSETVAKKIIPLLISVVSLGVLSWVNWRKTNKDSEDKDDDETIRSRSSIVEVLVPSDCVRSIIGLQGANIKEIQQKTNTRISLKDKKNSLDDETDKFFVIRGGSVNIQQAELEIKRLISDKGRLLTEEYYVPDYVVGRLIGKNGSNIREMCTASNCSIKCSDRKDVKRKPSKNCTNIVETMSGMKPSEKQVILLIGSTEQISCAKNLIINKITEEEGYRLRKNKQNNCKLRLLNEYSIKHMSRETSSTDLRTDSPTGFSCKKADLEDYLDQNKQVDVYVSAVSDPLIFWVQVIDNCSALRKMNEELEDYLVENPNCFFKNIDEVKVGMLVTGSFKNRWFRAEIQGYKFMNNKKMLDVFYVDYGNCEYLDVKELRRLPEKFAVLPWQAIECSLDDIADGDWTEESIIFFENIVDSCQQKPLKLTHINSSISKRNVKINSVLLADKENKSISEMLVNKGYSKYLNSPIIKGDIKLESNKIEEDSPTKGW